MVAEAAERTMNDQHSGSPEGPTTDVVVPGSVTGGAALRRPAASQARWARAGLLGIAAAALIAVAALAVGATAAPTGTLAAGTGTGDDSPTSGAVNELHGGPGGPGFRGGHGFGGITITAISGSSISLATEDGWTRTITVDDDTAYTKAGDDVALGDLAVGDAIGFRQTLKDDGTWSIDAIAVILPHVGGEVTAVDGSTITIEQRGGTSATIHVGADTNIVVDGDAGELADIQVGMFLVAEGTENSDGSLDATRVKAADAGSFRVRGGPDGGFKGPGFFGHGHGDEPDGTPAPEATGSASEPKSTLG